MQTIKQKQLLKKAFFTCFWMNAYHTTHWIFVFIFVCMFVCVHVCVWLFRWNEYAYILWFLTSFSSGESCQEVVEYYCHQSHSKSHSITGMRHIPPLQMVAIAADNQLILQRESEGLPSEEAGSFQYVEMVGEITALAVSNHKERYVAIHQSFVDSSICSQLK